MTPDASRPRSLVVGVTGATGLVYAVRALEVLRSIGVETHLVVSRAAHLVRSYETDLGKVELESLADHVYGPADVGAPPSSGSFLTLGMLIVPASMRTVGEIASGVSSSLVSRAADVTLKERRPLVLMVRESPLNLIHLRNMTTITEAGGTIFPVVPAFHTGPATIDDLVDHTVGRALDQFRLHTDIFPRWDDELRRQVAREQPDANSAG